ncbi:MAG: beta-galactosidase trimerization domain-containing protein [Planctomycetota bacterium]|jgi:hypothetical protein|nr:beta-galactosidase trimerization domain-containing protein [Planctomycetota bacterium]
MPFDEDELQKLVDEFDALGLDVEDEDDAEALPGELDLPIPDGDGDDGPTSNGLLAPPGAETAARQTEIVETMVVIPGRERNGWLLKLLGSESNIAPHVKDRIVSELSVSADESALPALGKMLKSSHGPVAFSAARVIGHVGGRDAVKLLGPALMDKRRMVRVGAIEGLGYSESEAAAPLIDRFLHSAITAEREAARNARRELQWRSGKPMDTSAGPAKSYSVGSPAGYTIVTGSHVKTLKELPDSANQRAILTIGNCAPQLEREFAEKVNQQALKALLSRGGIIWIATDQFGAGLRSFLKFAGVKVPAAETSDMGPPEVFVSPGDPWNEIMWPRNLMHESTLKLHASGFWAKWDKERQVAPFRSPSNPSRAALIVQTGVFGKCSVVFSRIRQVIANPNGVDLQWYFLDAMAAIVNPHALAVPTGLRVNSDFVSPHVPWARPLAGQKLKVLFSPQASCSREAIEIAQRVDCDYRVVPYLERSNPFHPKFRDSGVLDPLAIIWLQNELGKPWDVLVTGSRWVGVGVMCYGIAWHQWPESLRLYVRKKVFREGRGLVVFYDHVAAYGRRTFDDLRPNFVKGVSAVASAFPEFERESTLASGKWLTLAEVGKGKAVFASRSLPILDGWTVKNPLSSLAFVEPSEYWYALLARSVQVTGNRTGTVRIEKLDLANLPQGKIVVDLRNATTKALPARATFRLRDKLDRIVVSREVPLQLPASAEVSCVIDVGPVAKPCIGEFFARDEGGNILGWGNWAIPGAGSGEITELSFDRDLYPLNSSITVSGQLNGEIGNRGSVRVALTDVHDRVISKAEAPIEEGADVFRCTLPTGTALSRLVHAEVVVLEGERPIAGREQGLLVDVYPRTDFPTYYTGPLASRDQARELGYDAGGSSLNDALKLGLEQYGAGFDQGMHGMYGISGHGPASLLNRETLDGWSSPKYHLTQWERAKELGPAKRLAGVRVTIIADEDSGWYNGWHKMGFAPSTLHEFHQRLRKEYGALDALNRGWETDFKRWRDVRPMHLSELGERKSAAAWVDHRVFMEWQYAWRRTFSDVMLLKQYVPDAKVGFSTAGDDNGWDVYHMAKAQTGMTFQLGIQQRKYCSWTKPGDFVATWFGGYQVPPRGEPRNEKACRYFPWYQLFSGMTGMILYTDLPGGRHGVLNADLSPTWPARWIGEELREIKAGPAKLLLSATRDLGAIATYYSGPSQFTHMAKPPFVKEAKWGYGAEHRFVDLGWQELGWPQRWVAPEEVQEGILQNGKFKLLVMSAISALSKAEAENVRRYVAEGGTLLGTVDVGSRDEHGGAPLRGQLSDVFGFEYLPDQPLATGIRKRQVTLDWNGRSYDLGETPTPVRPLKVTTARELSTTLEPGNAPHVLFNKFGKGRALFFNLSPRLLRTFGKWEGQRSLEYEQMLFFLRDLAIDSDADPDIEVSLPDNETLWRVDISPFRSGTASYYGVMDGVNLFRASGWTKLDNKPYQTRNVKIRWDKPGHIYEIRSNRYLGHTSEIELPLRQATALLFAHLPYTITGIQTARPAQAERGKPLPIRLHVAVSEGEAERHVCRVEVSDATGKARPEYSESVLCPEGRGEFVLPIAFNDPAGKWTVRAREVVSGSVTKVSVEVR